jgi:hypothetical protein
MMESMSCGWQPEGLPLEKEICRNGRHITLRSQGSVHEGLEHGGLVDRLLDDAVVERALGPRVLVGEELRPEPQ